MIHRVVLAGCALVVAWALETTPVAAQAPRVDVVSVDATAFPTVRATLRVFLAGGERAESLNDATVRVVEDGARSRLLLRTGQGAQCLNRLSGFVRHARL